MRELAALVLVGANALLLLVGLIDLLVPFSPADTFTHRAGAAFFAFVGLNAILLPLLAVLLATHIQPTVPRAKLITQVALVEYAAAALFAVISFLGWLIGSLVHGQLRLAFTGLLTRVAWFGIFAIAAFAVFKIWRTLYFVPKPKPQPGVYGRPQSAPPHAQPGYPQPGYPAGQPTTYGTPYPAAQPTFAPGHAPSATDAGATDAGATGAGATDPEATQVTAYHPPQTPAPPAQAQQASAPPAQAPASAPPATSAEPASAPPASPASASPTSAEPSGAEPTQVIPPRTPDSSEASGSEATQMIPPRTPDNGNGSEATQMIIPASRRPAPNDDDGSNRRD